jgi:hypothetical protein
MKKKTTKIESRLDGRQYSETDALHSVASLLIAYLSQLTDDDQLGGHLRAGWVQHVAMTLANTCDLWERAEKARS